MQNQLINPKTQDVITVSNSWLYYRKTVKGKAHWYPYSLEKKDMLITLKLALTGDEIAKDSAVFKNTFIRFGWLDKGLKDLQWVSLEEVLIQFKDKKLKKTIRAKLDHVCRLLFISIKDIKHD